MKKARLTMLILVLVFAFSAFSGTAFADREEITGTYTHKGGFLKVDYYFFHFRVNGYMKFEVFKETPNGDVPVTYFEAYITKEYEEVNYGTWYEQLPAGEYKYKLSYPVEWVRANATPSSVWVITPS
jgi:hypothetical protein